MLSKDFKKINQVTLKKAETWDPWRQCLHSGQMFSGATEYKETIREQKNNCVHEQLEQIFEQDIKRPKTQLLLKVSSIKAGYCSMIPAYSKSKVADHPSHPPAQTLDLPLPSLPLGNKLAPMFRSKQGNSLLVFDPCSSSPVKPCLNVLSGLLSISTD